MPAGADPDSETESDVAKSARKRTKSRKLASDSDTDSDTEEEREKKKKRAKKQVAAKVHKKAKTGKGKQPFEEGREVILEDVQTGSLAGASALFDQYKNTKIVFEQKEFTTTNIDVHHLLDPPSSLRAKPFDQDHVLEMVARWLPERCHTAHAVLWDLPDGTFTTQYGSLYDFGVSTADAEYCKNLSAQDFERICSDNNDRKFRRIKLYVTSGRHTSRALEHLVDGGKQLCCYYTLIIH